MIAPVRELAAQVLALLLTMAPPEEIQRPCCQVLVKLASSVRKRGARELGDDGVGDGSWEVRHGAMLGFKYVAELWSSCDGDDDDDVAGDRDGDTSIGMRCAARMDSCWRIIPEIAIRGLEDESDDVRGAAAQVLSRLLTNWTSRLRVDRGMYSCKRSVTDITTAKAIDGEKDSTLKDAFDQVSGDTSVENTIIEKSISNVISNCSRPL